MGAGIIQGSYDPGGIAMRSITVPSDKNLVYEVQEFVEDCLSDHGASPKTLMQLELVVEEIFVNIASYAYNPPGSGDVETSSEMYAPFPTRPWYRIQNAQRMSATYATAYAARKRCYLSAAKTRPTNL